MWCCHNLCALSILLNEQPCTLWSTNLIPQSWPPGWIRDHQPPLIPSPHLFRRRPTPPRTCLPRWWLPPQEPEEHELLLLTPNQPRTETSMETETESTTNTTISDKLLLLRKDYKKTSVAMAKARLGPTYLSYPPVQRRIKHLKVCRWTSVARPSCQIYLMSETDSPAPPNRLRKVTTLTWTATIMWWSENSNRNNPSCWTRWPH